MRMRYINLHLTLTLTFKVIQGHQDMLETYSFLRPENFYPKKYLPVIKI